MATQQSSWHLGYPYGFILLLALTFFLKSLKKVNARALDMHYCGSCLTSIKSGLLAVAPFLLEACNDETQMFVSKRYHLLPYLQLFVIFGTAAASCFAIYYLFLVHLELLGFIIISSNLDLSSCGLLQRWPRHGSIWEAACVLSKFLLHRRVMSLFYGEAV
uniref:Uncharacterized protein n=1 Tax=Salix viminalis TaxID=40686 RepID=A0A6N2LM66_SALVM